MFAGGDPPRPRKRVSKSSDGCPLRYPGHGAWGRRCRGKKWQEGVEQKGEVWERRRLSVSDHSVFAWGPLSVTFLRMSDALWVQAMLCGIQRVPHIPCEDPSHGPHELWAENLNP